jgi:hypothetical protein
MTVREGVASFGKFDLIVANLVLHEAFRDKADQVGRFSPDTGARWDLSEVKIREEDEALRRFLASIAGLLDQKKAMFVSTNRIPNPEVLWWWHQLLEASGLRPSLSRGYMLSFENVQEEKEDVPITVARRAAEGQTRTTADDALSLYGYPKIVDMNPSYEYDLAETIFKSLGPKTLLMRIENVYRDGSGIGRIELWACPVLSCVYETTNHGYRRLRLFPKVATFEQVPRILAENNQAEAGGKVTAKTEFTAEFTSLALHLDVGIIEVGESAE